ncbi:uncharacterized protein LOC107795236 [Nicotiana tabacum]|uniref:Neuron navigator 1-like n=2 Tax=Nicotiana TaxID=4085 RepID=A0A1S4A9K4_TOBAC|nr:PREDICTED: neuron navigator 1-like [Nicotiana sylvestris]XP_016473317.1 PREDICTED: neuron navigator 1-like [Nicotiana tabacum]
MATSAAHLIQDQNINIHFDGASLLGKTDTSKASKKGGGGLGGRKALNDISNSAKPSALQAKKNYSSNVISIAKDLDATRNKVTDKGGRKALSDLTNSSKLSAKQAAKNKKLSTAAAANVPTSIAEERFLHDHQKCIKSQRKAMDIDYFLKEVGLDNDVPVQLAASPRASKLSMKSMLESPVKYFEVEEMPELLMYDKVPRFGKMETCGDASPSIRSPTSPKLSSMSWWKDGSTPCFTLIESPVLPKH